MALLRNQDFVQKKIIKAIEEDRRHDIAQLGNYYKPYINNLHVNGKVCNSLCDVSLDTQITSSTSAESIINFLRKYISLHGIPRTIRTDQGSEFISKEV